MICPRCELPLRRAKAFVADRFDCQRCEGRAVKLSAVLAQLSREEAVAFERTARARAVCGGRTRCPKCLARTTQVQLGETDAALCLDACSRCALVWLDRGEWLQLVRREQRSLTPQEIRGAQVRWRLELSKLRDDQAQETQAPDSAAHVVAGVLDLPISYGIPPSALNVATWASLVGMVLFSIWSLREPLLIDVLGFKPAQPLRMAGLTLFTSALLHRGWLHLLGNAYFLVLFGRPVEHVLGTARFAALFACAELFGDGACWMAHSNTSAVVVGASSAISGVMVYCALALPQMRIKMFLRETGRWFTVSGRMALGAWLLLQLVGAAKELAGFSSIAHVAHLGGAAAGMAFHWMPFGAARADPVDRRAS